MTTPAPWTAAKVLAAMKRTEVYHIRAIGGFGERVIEAKQDGAVLLLRYTDETWHTFADGDEIYED